VQGGVAISTRNLQALLRTRVLDRVRSMSLSIETARRADHADRFLRTPFGSRLEHVELFVPELDTVDPEPWRRVHERNQPLSLGLRGIVDGWIAVIVRQRGSIAVQLGDPSSARHPDLWPLVPAIASLGRGLGSITVERVGEDRFGIDLRPAAHALRRVFPTVEVASTHRWRSP
jgi:hypothetical protein